MQVTPFLATLIELTREERSVIVSNLINIVCESAQNNNNIHSVGEVAVDIKGIEFRFKAYVYLEELKLAKRLLKLLETGETDIRPSVFLSRNLDGRQIEIAGLACMLASQFVLTIYDDPVGGHLRINVQENAFVPKYEEN